MIGLPHLATESQSTQRKPQRTILTSFLSVTSVSLWQVILTVKGHYPILAMAVLDGDLLYNEKTPAIYPD